MSHETPERERIVHRRLARRGLLRGFAFGGVGIAAAAILGCTDDDAGEAMDDAMTPTADTMIATPTATQDAMADGMSGSTADAVDHDLGPAQEYALHAGWYRGDEVTYYDFGMHSPTQGASVGTAPIWAFITGTDASGTPQFVDGQHNIVDAVPGDEGYSDLWEVNFVVVPEGYVADSIRSKADLDAMSYEVMQPGVFVNCPILPAGSTLEGGAALTQGWYRGERVYYPDFGTNPPVGIPIWAFATGMDAAGNPLMVEGQRNIIDAIPGDEGYSDFWHVRLVIVNEGYEPESITSAAEVADSGFEVMQTPMMVNCPVVPRA